MPPFNPNSLDSSVNKSDVDLSSVEHSKKENFIKKVEEAKNKVLSGEVHRLPSVDIKMIPTESIGESPFSSLAERAKYLERNACFVESVNKGVKVFVDFQDAFVGDAPYGSSSLDSFVNYRSEYYSMVYSENGFKMPLPLFLQTFGVQSPIELVNEMVWTEDNSKLDDFIGISKEEYQDWLGKLMGGQYSKERFEQLSTPDKDLLSSEQIAYIKEFSEKFKHLPKF